MASGFVTNTRKVIPGDPVSAGVTNRAPEDAFNNTQYLKSLIDALQLGQALVLHGQPVEADALVGQPVAWSASNLRYERGLASLSFAGGLPSLAPAALVRGVIRKKTAATSADITIGGVDVIDLTNAISATPAAGLYYLSGLTAGKITATAPNVPIPVLYADGQGNVFLVPNSATALFNHLHLKFALTCLPAGQHEPPSVGDPHVIIDPDVTLPGWLPAGHSSFDGNAPTGAKFGYNFEAASAAELKAAWPPIPTSSAVLVHDRGEDPTKAGQDLPSTLAVINGDGIWWMSDCYGDVPWPTDFDTFASEAPPDEICPRDLAMSLLLYFIKGPSELDKLVVSSLRPGSSKVQITCVPDGTPAIRGDLEIDISAVVASSDDDELGSLAFKTLDEDTGELARGRIVEGLIAGSDDIVLDGSVTRRLIPEDTTTDLVHQGIVSVASSAATAPRELPVTLIRLDGVNAEAVFDVPGLGFRADATTGYRAMVEIPPTGVPTTPQLQLRFWILGRSAGQLPILELSVRRLPRPDGGAEALPTVDTTITLTTGQAVGANEYAEVTSEAFEVDPGDSVLFSLFRPAPDSFGAEIFILRQVGVLAPAA